MIPGFLRRFIAGAPQRKARRLARDARTVVSMVEGTYREPAVSAVARQVAGFVEGTDAVAGDAQARERWGQHLRSLHADSRRSQDQIALSALTLAIIEWQARALGAEGEDARAVVAAFAGEPPAGGPGPAPEGQLRA